MAKIMIAGHSEMPAGAATHADLSPPAEFLDEARRMFGLRACLYRPKRGKRRGQFCLGYMGYVSATRSRHGAYYDATVWRAVSHPESWEQLMVHARAEHLLQSYARAGEAASR